MRYTSEIGAPARADNLGTLTTLAAAYGLQLENWHGARIAVDRTNSTPLHRRARVSWPPARR
jgi:hypothetical protein